MQTSWNETLIINLSLTTLTLIAVQTGWTKPDDLRAIERHNTHGNVRVTPACAEFTTILQARGAF